MSDVMLIGILRAPAPEPDDILGVSQLVQTARQAADRIESDRDEIERLRAEVERLERVEENITNLISESQGVYGLHLNGDPSPWGELLPGGRFEEWLIDVIAE